MSRAVAPRNVLALAPLTVSAPFLATLAAVDS